MPTLGLVVQPTVSAAASRAADRALLDRAAAGEGTLRLAALDGDVLALGRYHRMPAGSDGVVRHRRRTGGRVWAGGAGFLQVSLSLPHRAALVGDEPSALRAEQVLNRCVRGVMGGLDAAGVSSYYPGRDLLTCGGLPLAALGLEVDARGATLFEATVSVERDASLLPHLLDRADADGVVRAPMLGSDDVTSVGRVLGRVPSFDELVARIRHGYETRSGVTFVDAACVATADPDDAAWMTERLPRGELDRHAVVPTMLGVLEVHCAVGADGTFAAVQLAGDVLADSPTIARLEAVLRGCPPVPARIAAALSPVLAAPQAFVLGVGPIATLVDAIAAAAT